MQKKSFKNRSLIFGFGVAVVAGFVFFSPLTIQKKKQNGLTGLSICQVVADEKQSSVVKTAKVATLPYTSVKTLAAFSGVFREKCVGCHTIDAISEQMGKYTSANKVDFLVGWMKKIPNSGITATDAHKIALYLKYEGLYKEKCNGCHTIASVQAQIQSYAAKGKVKNLVNWMKAIPNSQISARDVNRIVNYLKATYRE